ncbi:ISAzo13-like element transposase-related protein [Streptomyces sp. TRM68367]|uniref:ISAzo13-like element transposase-related protein n=1 Tax=Streptomyces sp. TRM68367 TaxID=2758415 RepID=UPI0037DC9656
MTSYETALNLTSSTTTRTGLAVTARPDTGSYPTGIEISEQHAAALTLHPEDFHGEWNHTIPPQPGVPDVPLHPPGRRSHPRHAHTFGATLATHPPPNRPGTPRLDPITVAVRDLLDGLPLRQRPPGTASSPPRTSSGPPSSTSVACPPR